MKVVQFGLCYSPNLGDGVIADCLGHGLRAARPGLEVVHVDLSGRAARGAVTIRNREAILAVLDRLPLALRQALARYRLNRLLDGVEAGWRTAAAGADLAVIGGGQLFADASLNFPLKIARAARVLAAEGTPVAVHAVGVSRNWTPAGKDLFAEVLGTDLRIVGTRDAASARAWSAQMPGGPAPRLTADPGLLAAECYGWPEERTGGVGLCVTDFGILRHHADGGVAGSARGAAEFYAGIVLALVAEGHRVTLFCNGAAEDAALMARLAGRPELADLRRDGRLLVPPLPATPAELAHRIAGFDAVVAHRLHACIVAFSYGVPVVGLGWDSKLGAFFDAIGGRETFTDDPRIDGADIARITGAALQRGTDEAVRERMTAEARSGIEALLACVEAG